MTFAIHPKQDEHGKPFRIEAPSSASHPDSWHDPLQIATVTPGGAMPASLNGIAFTPCSGAPVGQDAPFAEPAFEAVPGKVVAAGVVIEEPDGRVWVVHPANAFGGYPATFPKGRRDADMPLPATAIREAWEESGLQVVLTGFLCDLVRSRSKTRYYLGRRIGGCPADMGWESQAVSLAPRAQLGALLVNPNDAPLVALLQAQAGTR